MISVNYCYANTEEQIQRQFQITDYIWFVWGLIWENNIETCILSYVKQITSPGSMHETGCSGLVHWDDPEGWDGEGGGRGVQDGEQM